MADIDGILERLVGRAAMARRALAVACVALTGCSGSAGPEANAGCCEARNPSFQADPAPSDAIELVETAPIETPLDHPDIPEAADVWPAMIAGSTRSLDVAQFYISEAPGSRLSPVLAAIEAAADRGVAVRLLVDQLFYKRYPETVDRLAARRGIAVRRFDVGAKMGGVLHAKYFVIDGREAWIGSQNFDWRSLAHIQEIGVRVRSAPAAEALARVFAMDWDLAAGGSGKADPSAPGVPIRATAAGGIASILPVMSPKGFLPDPASWELPRIIAMIDGARRAVHVQVLAYKTSSRDGSAFPDLDDALRRAAARGVSVRLLCADWAKAKGSIEPLQALAHVPNVEVKLTTIPPWSGGFIPFARVAHAKYMVVDGARAWIGTSNWEGDYFTRSRNVGLVVEGAAFGEKLDRVFQSGWGAPFAAKVDPGAVYTPPDISGEKR